MPAIIFPPPYMTTGLAMEGGHWYRADGSPAYEIAMKNGAMRPVNLRDARKLNLFPGVSSILGCAAKPMLEKWKIEQAILAALTLPRIAHETDSTFAKRALTDSQEQARIARDKGTAIHAGIEWTLQGRAVDDNARRFATPVVELLCERFGAHDWNTEHSFACPFGYGGKIDLCRRTDVPIVLDFKTKDFVDPDTVRAYDDHGMQLAAYAMGLSMDHCVRVNLFVSTRVPGLIVPWVWGDDTYDKHRNMFLALLRYWQHARGYAPRWM